MNVKPGQRVQITRAGDYAGQCGVVVSVREAEHSGRELAAVRLDGADEKAELLEFDTRILIEPEKK